MAGKAIPRPRPWLPLDLDYLDQDTVRALASEFGPAGPLTFLALVLEAGKQARAGLPPSKQGIVKTRAAAIGQAVGVDAETVGRIVDRCVSLDLLELLAGTDAGAGRLVARSLKRDAWEPRDAGSSARTARYRQQPADEDRDYIDF